LADDCGGFGECERLRGVDDVGGGEAVVQPAGVGADAFRYCGGEGEDVVARFGLDGVDALDGEAGALAEGFGC